LSTYRCQAFYCCLKCCAGCSSHGNEAYHHQSGNGAELLSDTSRTFAMLKTVTHFPID
jgi:hypothetical protein